MITLYGGKHIADRLGVTNGAFCNWRARYIGTPEPTHCMADGMPLWDESGLTAWIDWRARILSRRLKDSA